MSSKISLEPDIKDFHRGCVVADLHADTWLWNHLLGYDIRKHHRRIIPGNPFFNHIDIPRAIEGGLNITGQGVVVFPFPRGKCLRRGHRMTDRIRKGIAENTDWLELVHGGTHAEEAVKRGKIGVFIGIEGAHILSGSLDAVGHFYAKGARYLTLGHFSENEAVYSSNDKANADKGLKPFGRDVIRKTESLRMMIDLAHVAPGCFRDIIKIATRPVIVSHIGMKAVYNHWRNIDDDQVRAIAETGGVIGIIFHPYFLAGGYWSCPLDTVVSHIEHCMDVAGEDHVALGSDFDGIITTPEGLRDISALPNLTQRLLDRGHSKETVQKILGKNFLRVFKEVCG